MSTSSCRRPPRATGRGSVCLAKRTLRVWLMSVAALTTAVLVMRWQATPTAESQTGLDRVRYDAGL